MVHAAHAVRHARLWYMSMPQMARTFSIESLLHEIDTGHVKFTSYHPYMVMLCVGPSRSPPNITEDLGGTP